MLVLHNGLNCWQWKILVWTTGQELLAVVGFISKLSWLHLAEANADSHGHRTPCKRKTCSSVTRNHDPLEIANAEPRIINLSPLSLHPSGIHQAMDAKRSHRITNLLITVHQFHMHQFWLNNLYSTTCLLKPSEGISRSIFLFAHLYKLLYISERTRFGPCGLHIPLWIIPNL